MLVVEKLSWLTLARALHILYQWNTSLQADGADAIHLLRDPYIKIPADGVCFCTLAQTIFVA